MLVLAVDLGSTHTKLTALDAERARVLGTASAFTTVASNVMEGFGTALERLEKQLGRLRPDHFLCCSSAGGGLSMVAVGLVPDLTAKAARMAAESAGAKVLKTYSFEISDSELREIERLDPDIVLLAGGTDGGNKEVIVRNARLLGGLDRDFCLIAAGNKSAAAEIEAALRPFGRARVITANVMPRFGSLNIEPARAAIRDIFIRRIIQAKGLATLQAMADKPVIPTPLAVLKACELLSLGTADEPGIGEFMAVDLGGATTDVYSMASGEASRDNVLVKGLPEPYAKRSVEGDLGMRHSAPFLLEAAGCEELAREAGVAPPALAAWVARCRDRPESLAPEGSDERRMEETLARAAVAGAVERHCGVLEKGYSPLGELYTLTGKDLGALKRVVGIGGALVNSARPEYILAGAAATPQSLARGRMLPLAPDYYLDKDYIFSAMGLVSLLDRNLALRMLKKSLYPLGAC